MENGKYEPEPPREFFVYDPKKRLISALPFRDRVAQHALVNVIGTIFEKTLLPRTYACRPGKGTHAAVVALQADMRRPGAAFALKTDFAKYFNSIDRATLHRLIRKKITCQATLGLIETMVPRDGRGVPIGALTSQLFANVYAGQVDRLIQCDLGRAYWHRYMDDIVVLGASVAELRAVKEAIETYSDRTLGLRLSRWSIAPVARGVGFLGYRIWPTHKLLGRRSVTAARRRIRALAHAGDAENLERFLASWTGHAKWADAVCMWRPSNAH